MGRGPRKGKLLVVGTPIGNLGDLSPRAQRALSEADAVLCEDTRVTAKLAARFGLAAPRFSCPPPRERSRVPEMLRRLEAGETVAVVSDAGMPGLSDPGEHLVRAAAEAGYPVLVVPGPSAPAAALAVSGLPAVPHVFLGFLPSRAAERRRLLARLADRQETLVWFEAPHRLVESLSDAAGALGRRRACVARELTKIHEETARGTLEELAALFGARARGRGEATVVVEGSGNRESQAERSGLSQEALDREIREALEAGSDKRALARRIALRAARPSREVYARAVELSRDMAGRGGREREKA